MNQFLERHVVKAVFDAAATDTSDVSNLTADAHPLGVYIPDNAIVVNAFYDVITTFTSTAGGTDKATVALMIQGAGDLVVAIAIETGTPWDAGLHGTLAGSPAVGSDATTLTKGTSILFASVKAASFIKTTARREVTATVGTQALISGKLNLYIEYIMSE